MDDFLVMARKMLMTDHREFVLHTHADLGWTVNFEKCQLNPSTSTVSVGFSMSMHGKRGPWIKVLPQKIRKMRCAIVPCLNSNSISARGLARITGQCMSMTKAIVLGKLLSRNVYRVLASRNNWNSLLVLPQQARADLKWWLDAVRQ